jgi:hypothetical protein
MFKGYDQVIHAIYTYTTSCSVTLEINKEYLFTGAVLTTLPKFNSQHWLLCIEIAIDKMQFSLSVAYVCP